MKKILLPILISGAVALLAANRANAQETVVTEEDFTAVAVTGEPCSDKYYSSHSDNWFLQLGAGMNLPIVENELANGNPKRHFTPTYNLGVGKWMTPYLGWRFSTYYSLIRWDNGVTSTAKMANANFDLMWDMCNSIAGYDYDRPVSVIPFVGIGGTFAWDFDAPATNIIAKGNKMKSNSWTLPVSAGIQLRFRLCKYADFFIEGRASLYGDNFNNCAYGKPLDIDVTAIGGFTFNFGGREFKSYNPCTDTAYITALNGEVNALRNSLTAATTALAVAESQTPCPEVTEVVQENIIVPPLMSTVRFTINSAKISPEEMVNVYNVAQYMKENPAVNVTICGYADKDTGTADYNKDLSARRAQAVYDALTKTYSINANRLSIQAEGSAVQPYDTNNWNRIVIFVPAN